MTSRNRFSNRCRVNFIDHRFNHCPVFLAKTTDIAAMKFKHFLAAFKRKLKCQINVICTYGGVEYKTIDVICKTTGVLRQVNETNNQASNGKYERMHRALIDMVRRIFFASGLVLSFWGPEFLGLK